MKQTRKINPLKDGEQFENNLIDEIYDKYSDESSFNYRAAMKEYANVVAMEYAKSFKDLVHKQSLAIGLIMKHFPKDILSDQMGEDHDTFLESIK